MIKFKVLVSILALLAAIGLFTTNISGLQALYKLSTHDRRAEATDIFRGALLNFAVQVLFLLSLGVLLFFEAIEETNNSRKQ